MPSLKALRTRINSVKSTQKITSAMKMVAASKLRRAQQQAEAARRKGVRLEAPGARTVPHLNLIACFVKPLGSSQPRWTTGVRVGDGMCAAHAPETRSAEDM